jgi:two-component system, response regulator, stage 0 sporulation protein F
VLVGHEPGSFSGLRADFPVGKHRLRVLIVEDEFLIRWPIAEMLEHAGHEVVQAADAAGAVRALQDADPAPDVVLLDLRLPDVADFSLLEHIRRVAPSTVIVLMTAYATPEITSQALRLGACRVMNKPFDMHAIEPALVDAVDSSGLGA